MTDVPDWFLAFAARGAKPVCLACGSEDVIPSDRRVALFTVNDEGLVDLIPDEGRFTGVECVTIVCGTCGYVALFHAPNQP